MALKESAIQLAPGPTCLLRGSFNQPGTSEAIETFRVRTTLARQHPLEDIRELRVLCQNDQDTAEVIAKEAVVLVGLDRHFLQSGLS